MFRFRNPTEPPARPQPWHAHAKRAAGAAARGGLLASAAAAKATADALRWAAERKPVPPAPPPVEPVPVFIVSPPPAVLAARRPPSRRGGQSSSKVLPILAVALLVGFAVALSGVKGRPKGAAPPPPPQNLARLSPAKLSEYATDSGVVGGAKAALKALEQQAKTKLTEPPAPPEPPAPARPVPPDRAVPAALNLLPDPATVKPRTAVRLTGVRSEHPHTTKEAALADALLVAQARLRDQLLKLDPPLEAVPAVGLVRADYLRPGSDAVIQPTAAERAAWEAAGVDPNRVWVTCDVEMSDDQVRQLRSDRRLASAAPVFLLPLVLSGGLWGFLRLDALTRGHLTGWLVAGVGGLVIAAAAVAALVAPW